MLVVHVFIYSSYKYLCYIYCKKGLGKHSETSTSCLSQVSGMEHGRVPCKRRRTFKLTEYQLSEFEKRFKSDPYIKGVEKELMANNLGITKTLVSNWFIYERRLKRNIAKEASNATVINA